MTDHALLDIRHLALGGYVWMCECGESGSPRPSRHAAYCGHGTHQKQMADAAEEARTATAHALACPVEEVASFDAALFDSLLDEWPR